MDDLKIKYIRIPLYAAAFVLTAVFTYIFKISGITQKADSYGMDAAGLPVVYMVTEGGICYNHTYGLKSEADYAQVRSTITPVGTDREMSFVVDTYGCRTDGVCYEVRSLDGSELLERTVITDYKAENDKIRLNVKFKNLLEKDREYMLKITVSTEKYGEADYYTRIVMMDKSDVDSKLQYVRNFSLKTQSQDTLNEIIPKLEPDSTGDNTNLGHVNIHSRLSQVGFGKLGISLDTEMYISLNEIYGDIASLSIRYSVSNSDDNGTYSYDVREFYRINRVDETLTYVYSFDRFMDQIFNTDMGISAGGYVYLGITSSDDIVYKSSQNGGIVCFERNNDLWMYNLSKDKFTLIFSFCEETSDGLREKNDSHGYRIMDVDKKGNVKFIVYGYMNRGIHEGNNGLAAYSYSADTNVTKELIFIPMEEPFRVIEGNVDKLAYINEANVLYFYRNRSIYYMNYETKECMLVDSGVISDKCMLSEDNVLMYQTGESENDCTEIKLVELSTGKILTIECEEDERIKALGFIDGNPVYGTARCADTDKEENLFPMNTIRIVDNELVTVREYREPGYYVTGAEFYDTKIVLNRIAKDKNGEWKSAEADQLLSNSEEKNENVIIKVISSDDRQKETYIDMKGSGSSHTAVQTAGYEFPADSLIYIRNEFEMKEEFYYVYTYGELYRADTDKDAMIETARDTGGVVVDSSGNVIWTRYMK